MKGELDKKLVVNSDVSIVDVNVISEIQAAGLPVEGAEGVIYRFNSGGACMALDRAGVLLVEQFQKGCTIEEALSQVARQLGVTKEALAKSIYPLLEKLIRDQFVVELSRGAENRDAQVSQLYDEGDLFQGHRVIQRIGQGGTSTVFKVQLANGGYGALKVLRGDSKEGANTFRREHAILTRLNGSIAPRVLEARLAGEDIYILAEWIDGINVLDWSAGIGNLPRDQKHAEVRRLAMDIVLAFDELHWHNIAHSNIQPKNILIDRSGVIRILGFGLSRWPLTDEKFGLPPRTNVDIYKAPDLAMALLEGKIPAPASVASDIYSLGAILYRLIVGSEYLDFPREPKEQNRVICNDEMRSFASQGALPWSEMEQLLAEMLHKDPERRIASLLDCVKRLEVMPLPATQFSPLSNVVAMDAIPFVRSYVGETFDVPFAPPTASLFLGLGGLAYVFFRAGVLFQEQSLLLEAELLTRKARELISKGSEGSFSPTVFLAPEDIGEDSLFHHEEGIVMLQGLIAHTMGDRDTLRACCVRLLSWDSERIRPAEYMIGRSGILNALRQLSYLVVENEDIVSFGTEIAESLLGEIEDYGKIGRSRIKSLGFAHGWAGILHTLLTWSRSHHPQFVSRIVTFLEQLSSMKIVTPQGSYWPELPAEAGGEGDFASWCNGTGGQILLWAEAYKATGDKRWLLNAMEAGDHVARTVIRNFDLLCGAAGRALCLGHLYTLTQDETWWELAKSMLSQPRLIQDTYVHSLFKGIPGLEVARAELRRPDSLVFPTIASNQYGPPLSVGRLSSGAKK